MPRGMGTQGPFPILILFFLFYPRSAKDWAKDCNGNSSRCRECSFLTSFGCLLLQHFRVYFQKTNVQPSGKKIIVSQKNRDEGPSGIIRGSWSSFATCSSSGFTSFLWSFFIKLSASENRVPGGTRWTRIGSRSSVTPSHSSEAAVSWPLVKTNSRTQCPLSYSWARIFPFLAATSFSCPEGSTI